MVKFEDNTQVTVTDPVCGMEMALETAAAHEDYRGWAYFFCSPACHRLFRNAPKRYAAASARPGPDSPSGRAGE
jgi:YHS domain-containing protein